MALKATVAAVVARAQALADRLVAYTLAAIRAED